MHWESGLGLALGWPGTLLGNSFGSGPGVAGSIGECCGNGPWGGQVHWRMLWDWPLHWDFAWGVALGWQGALGICTGIGSKVASCIGNLVWDWPWHGQVHSETPWAVVLEWPVALESAVGMALGVARCIAEYCGIGLCIGTPSRSGLEMTRCIGNVYRDWR